jgi:hypothetical protein
MKDGALLVCDSPERIKAMSGESSIESAFIKIVKEAKL